MIIYDLSSAVLNNINIVEIPDNSLVRVTAFEGNNPGNSRIFTEKHHSTRLKIGKYCSISIGCKFILGCNHNYNNITTFLPFTDFLNIDKNLTSNGDITIGNDVWIGQDVTILSGVKIGDGAIIASGSTVAKDVEPYTISGGVPSKFIKKRFDEHTIKFLLESKWWDIDKNVLKENEDILFAEDIERFKLFIKLNKT